MPFSATAELCLRVPRPSGGSSDPEGRTLPNDKIEAIGRLPLAALDDIMRAALTDHIAGRLSDDEAQAIYEAVETRRQALKRPIQGHSPMRVVVVREGPERAPATNVASPAASRPGAARYRSRGLRQLVLRIPRPITYDRARSRQRRRRLAYSGPMPSHLADQLTPGEMAVMRIIADEHRDRGGCARSIGEIAARAGVCVRTVQSALRHAERIGLVTIQERRQEGARSLPNIVRVVSREWLAWLEHAPKARNRQGGGCKPMHPTDTLGFSRDSVGNVEAVNASATRRRHDRGPNRACCYGAL